MSLSCYTDIFFHQQEEFSKVIFVQIFTVKIYYTVTHFIGLIQMNRKKLRNTLRTFWTFLPYATELVK